MFSMPRQCVTHQVICATGWTIVWISLAFVWTASAVVAEQPAATSRPASQPSELVVALLQMAPAGSDREANLTKADRFCRDAAARGADIALMPEMWSVGYCGFDQKQPGAREAFQAMAVGTGSPWVQHFSRLARELRMAIAVTYLQAWDGAPRNAVTLFDRHGKEMFTYAKVHTCDFAPMEASTTPGTDFYVAEMDTRVGSVKVGAMICFDREQPESARILMLKGAELILVPNACELEELRLDQFKIRAWENVLDVAMANYPKPNNNGHSVAYDSSGKCRVIADEQEGLHLASFDLAQLRKARSESIWGGAYRRPHRYRQLLSLEQEDIWHRNDAFGKPFDPSQR
ncbi:MAG TPA: carbon-nitrogen hydrolase family protein [Phycisphaerae bacterium]|nr:carbon-nitrogen hydrolase family protein [Phycisphaerae bacterium]HRR86827.1 carbon-nitrogen hydrolase family protein [Phycisphaerae bacterium]